MDLQNPSAFLHYRNNFAARLTKYSLIDRGLVYNILGFIKRKTVKHMSVKVLIVEDDSNIAELIRLYLEKEEYQVRIAEDGRAGVEAFKEFKPDIILLDLMLPVMDGWSVCRAIRETDKTPIIMLTAKDETFDKVMGLEMGADDYISKPFEMKEVIARMRAVLRRTEKEEPEDGNKILEYDGISINIGAYEVIIKGKKVEMPPKELELLHYLASYPNRVFTRNQLLDDVWGFEYFGDSRTVDVHVKRLREKIDGASDKWSLKTVWGVGYKFEVEN